MTLDEANAIVSAHQTCKGKADPGEFMRYMLAREVVAKAGGLQMTAAQRGFLAASRKPLVGSEQG